MIVAAAWPTAHLHFGGVNMDNIPDVIISTNEELFDFQVSDAGDVNGDGFADVMVSTPSEGLFRVGKVFIYFGGSSVDNIADIILTGTENFQN
ncbi:MAG: FG-GAP repeat protein [Ignavibacteria bacterium]|nr:FG-GAP repeat protein [Ignavibacteria bacterium]